jgi:hypothetical protein
MLALSLILSYLCFKFVNNAIITDSINQVIIINYDDFDVYLIYILSLYNLVLLYSIFMCVIAQKSFSDNLSANQLFILINSILVATSLLLIGLEWLYFVAILIMAVPFLVKYFFLSYRKELEMSDK